MHIRISKHVSINKYINAEIIYMSHDADEEKEESEILQSAIKQH